MLKPMRRSLRPFFVLGAWLAIAPAVGRAQEAGLGVRLGGYGAMWSPYEPSMGGNYNIIGSFGMGNVIVPASGSPGAAASLGMSGDRLAFRGMSAAAMYASTPSFSSSSLSRRKLSFALEGSSLSAGMGSSAGGKRMPVRSSMGVMPRSIGYPFRRPPSLISTPAGAGMSM